MTKTNDYEIQLTLTPTEASALASILMDSVHWAGAGKIGIAARDIYAVLSEADVEQLQGWSPKDGGRGDAVSRDWEERL